MSALSPATQVVAQDMFTTSTTQQHVLGEKAYTPDGRKFRYVRAGAVALVAGEVIQSPAVVANHVNLTPTAVSAVGDRSVTVTLGATAATADQYAGGYVTVESATTGAGQTLRIKSHPAAASAGTLLLTLEDSFVVATSGTIIMSLVQSNYNSVIQTPVTTLTGTPVGVAFVAIPALSFGWIVSGGVTGVRANGIQTVGVGAAVPAAAAGSAIVMAATLFQIGTFCKTSVDTRITPCYVTLD